MLSFSLLLVPLLTVAAGVGPSQTPIKARTEAGKEVLLYPDGNWKYVDEKKASAADSKVHSKPANARTSFKTTMGSFEIWMDDSRWNKTAEEAGRMSFKLKTGDAYVLVISEEISMQTAAIKEAAIDNAKKAGSEFSLLADESRIVNGREVGTMKFNSTIRTIQLTYYGYYYGGKEGTIQVLCYTGQNLFSKYEKDFTEFLDGLTVQ